MYLTQNYKVSEEILKPHLLRFATKRPNHVAVMFSEEFIRGDIAVMEFASYHVNVFAQSFISLFIQAIIMLKKAFRLS